MTKKNKKAIGKSIPNQSNLVPSELQDYEPGASRALVLDALKKVAKSPKPSPKHGGQPASTS